MTPDARELLRAMLGGTATAADVPRAALPVVLGQLAELQAVFLARLVAGEAGQVGAAAAAQPEPVKLLTVAQAAVMFAVQPRWLYRHAEQIPETRRLSRKCLRFTEAGLRRYLARTSREWPRDRGQGAPPRRSGEA
jgi:hypothetical protein